MRAGIDAWQAYTQGAADTLSKCQNNEIGMWEAFRFFENNSAMLADKEALQSILDTISEIDGFPRDYGELRGLFASGPSRDALMGWLRG